MIVFGSCWFNPTALSIFPPAFCFENLTLKSTPGNSNTFNINFSEFSGFVSGMPPKMVRRKIHQPKNEFIL